MIYKALVDFKQYAAGEILLAETAGITQEEALQLVSDGVLKLHSLSTVESTDIVLDVQDGGISAAGQFN